MRYFTIVSLAAALLCVVAPGHPALALMQDDSPAADNDDSSADDNDSADDQSSQDEDASGGDEHDQDMDDSDSDDQKAGDADDDADDAKSDDEPNATGADSGAEVDQAMPHKKKHASIPEIENKNIGDALNRTMNCNPRLQGLQRSITDMDNAFNQSGISRPQASIAAYHAAKDAAIHHLDNNDKMNANQCSATTDAMVKQVQQETANLWNENKALGH